MQFLILSMLIFGFVPTGAHQSATLATYSDRRLELAGDLLKLAVAESGSKDIFVKPTLLRIDVQQRRITVSVGLSKTGHDGWPSQQPANGWITSIQMEGTSLTRPYRDGEFDDRPPPGKASTQQSAVANLLASRIPEGHIGLFEVTVRTHPFSTITSKLAEYDWMRQTRYFVSTQSIPFVNYGSEVGFFIDANGKVLQVSPGR